MSQPVTTQGRLAKFSLVGAMGVIIQLAVLSLLAAIRTNYLVATVAGVESAILHNFIWHRLFTWRERQSSLAESFSAFVRFNLSNGLISLVGNVLLTGLFSGEMHLPLLPANLMSIAICAIGNFWISDRWVFISDASASPLMTVTAPALAPATVAQKGDK